ncbi:MAG: hypothetical protein CME34_04985 [Gordonia sp.]|nr:hypothetical protein [Gordonia sp. (in: high G+C Gram-positive bacteria)]
MPVGVVAMVQVEHTRREQFRAPGPTLLGHLDQTTRDKCIRNQLVGVPLPTAIWTSITDPAQHIELTFMNWVFEGHDRLLPTKST